ncbi:MAG: phosphoserine phosphatase SerB [Desulfovibrio sp.]
MREIILVHITGEDKPGLTATLTNVLGSYGVQILDIGQSVIHNYLTLGILIGIPQESESAPILKALLFKAHELGVSLKLSPVDLDKYSNWVDDQGKPRLIITLLGKKITAEQLSEVTQVLAKHGLNIDIINRLSGRMPASEDSALNRSCVELSVRGTPLCADNLHEDFLEVSARLSVDIAFQEDNVFRRNRRLVAFDMDSTLIQAEVIDELAAEAGVKDQVSAITESAMRGEIDFDESLRQRLRLLKGLDASVLENVHKRLQLTDGAERLIRNLKKVGYKIAILSGGFTYFGEKLQEQLGIDYVYANKLIIENGKLTGEVEGDIVNGQMKATLLRKIANKEEISLQQVIAVGDGANDLPMLSIAGLGIAFHAKPKVKAESKQAISTMGLDSILYLIGVRDRELR